MALHATVNRNTGFTPNQLMLGREVILPKDLVIGSVRQSMGSTPEELVIDFSDRLSQFHHEAREQLKTSKTYQMKEYDLSAKGSLYEPGDFVYLRDRSTKKGKSPKLQQIWKGPFLVILSGHPFYCIRRRFFCNLQENDPDIQN